MLTVSDRQGPLLSGKAVHILEAAERCFARHGFHRATMQDVAREACMSPGNLYRYFPSKAEMVAGLIERDRALIIERLESIGRHADFREGFLLLCQSFLVDEPHERVVLWIDIWSESAHNREISELTLRCEREFFEILERIFEQAQTRGQLPQSFDVEAFRYLLTVMSDGLLVRRAVSPDFDAGRALALLDALFEAVLKGKLPLPSAKDFIKNTRAPAREETLS